MAAGTWTNDRSHGPQFPANFVKATAPTTLDGIENDLASGMIRGIGPAYAKRLVRAFGEAVFDVIEADPSRLREVEGIGPVRAKRIAAGWVQKVKRATESLPGSGSRGTPRVRSGVIGHASDAMVARFIRDGELFAGKRLGRCCSRRQ